MWAKGEAKELLVQCPVPWALVTGKGGMVVLNYSQCIPFGMLMVIFFWANIPINYMAGCDGEDEVSAVFRL